MLLPEAGDERRQRFDGQRRERMEVAQDGEPPLEFRRIEREPGLQSGHTVVLVYALVPLIAEIHDYYVDATQMYSRYAAGTGGWHVGLWDTDVTTHGQSIVATNRRLLAGLAIDANTHILDAGCGSGSLAIWAARRFGCRVTGITIVPQHVAMAQLSAATAEVGHLCDFQFMDMSAMTVPDATLTSSRTRRRSATRRTSAAIW